jgi:hypothetical protein
MRPDRGRVRAVLDTGLLDQEWLEAQTGASYAGPEEAAAAYLSSRPRLSPHPLVEPDWIAAEHDVPEGEDPLLWYAAHPDRSPHPLLAADDSTLVVERLRTDGPDTVLPVPSDLPPLTWGRFRALALGAVRRHRSRDTSGGPRRAAVEPAATAPHTDGPLVTVVLATQDQAPALRATVASLQAQGLRDWELVVVDDGSTDDTPQVLAGLAAYDDRISVVRVPRGGVGRARNEGLARARGRFVAFLDPGRAWAPDFLETMAATLDGRGWACAHARAGKSGRPTSRAQLLARNVIDLAALLVRTDVLRDLGGFDESLQQAGDHDLVLRLADRHDLHPVAAPPAEGDPVAPSEAWTSLVLARHLVDWEQVQARTAGRTSIVLVVRGNLAGIVEWCASLAAAADDAVELVVVGMRLRRSADTLLRVLSDVLDGVRYVPLAAEAANTVALDVGVARSTGEHLVLVNGQQVRADVPALRRLAPLLDEEGVALVQPLVLTPHDLVASAGAVFGPGRAVRPVPFLEGHAERDARAADGVSLPAPLGPVVAVRAETLVGLRGLDPLPDGLPEVALGLRVAREGLGRTVLAAGVRLTLLRPALSLRSSYPEAVPVLEERYGAPPPGSRAAWAAAGFEVVGVRHDLVSATEGRLTAKDVPLAVPHHVVVPRRRPLEVTEGLPSLRWVIDLASPAGRRGESWGDTHFARALAAALERLGQRVAVDPRPARHRPTRDHDDVLLVLRGLDRVAPRPGTVSLEWVISHPDLVDAAELASFDAVFAASAAWSTATTARTGVHVEPLLQCTDPALFHPGRAGAGPGADVLFVGSSRGVYRSAVRTAVAVGAPLTVHGVGWEPFVDRAAIASTYVPNEELGRLYASASVVLNDHWEDMRRDGFVSNRLFDATAAGARVISDDVAGLPADLGEVVRVYRDEADLRRLLDERDTLFPTVEERHAIADRIGAAHSFDARAATLTETAVRLVRERSAE